MWPFPSITHEEKSKEKLLDLKKITIGGIKFKIKRINPFLDFASDHMPQIFTDVHPKFNKSMEEKDIKIIDANIKPVLKAGIYSPILEDVGKGKDEGHEKGLTIDDLFIDREIAYKLFSEIVEHSLNRFKGINRLFFWIKVRLSTFILSQTNTENHP